MTIKGCEILEFEPLSKYSYMKTGGIAKKIIFPQSREGLLNALKVEKDFYILGNCSNVLFPDSGIEKTIIITTKMKKTEVFDDGEFFYITADAGASLGLVAHLACENSLTGLEFAHGIPGTAGGAVFMNAGAYGGEIKDVFHSCVCVDREGNVKFLNRDEMEFSYRDSVLQRENFILLGMTFKLKKGEKSQIKATMNDLMERRKSKQPLEYPSVGSFFKRPEGYFAAKLIEDAGLKGFSIGGAKVSEKHSGFVINAGGATTADILALGDYVEKTVFEKFGVHLEREVKIIV